MDDRFEDSRVEDLKEDSREEEKQESKFSNIYDLNNCFQEALRDLKAEKEGRQEERDGRDRQLERTPTEKVDELAKVLYQRNGEFYLPDERAETSERTVLAAAVALREETGGKLVMSPDALEAARHTSVETLKESLQTVIKTYEEERGAQYDVNSKIMFKNFPDSVEKMSDYEMRVNQLIGYIADFFDDRTGKTDVRDSISFDGPVRDRGELPDKIRVEYLRPADDDKYNTLVQNLIGGRTSLSEGERDIVSNAFKHQDVREIMPDKIPQKDTLAFVARISIDRDIPVEKLPLRNATDAMRVGKELNAYDRKEEKERDSKGREKSSKTGYYKFTNREKKFILSILERDRNIEANMKGKEPEFKALTRGLNGYRGAEQKYPHATRALNKVSNNERLPITADGRYEEARNRGEVLKAADMRKEFPGKFTKELDSLLTQSMTRDTAMGVVDRFSEVADRVPTRALFIAKNHFEQREEGTQIRTVSVKGAERYVHSYEKDVKPIDERAREKVIDVLDRGIKDQLREREPMGKVYIDERYKGIPLPKDTRTETDGMRTLSRGTRLDIPKEANHIRFFNHYKTEGWGGIVDMSAALFDKDLTPSKEEPIAWFSTFHRDWGTHSGDVLNSERGAAQTLDLNLRELEEKAKTSDVGYVAIELNSWSGKTMREMEENMFGYMAREEKSFGDIYDARTVDQAIELRSEGIATAAVFYDIENRQIIWSDIDLRRDGQTDIRPVANTTIENTMNNLNAALYASVNREAPSMYDILKANAEARGELVDDPRDADIVFGIDRDSDDTRAAYGMDRTIEVEHEDGTVTQEPALYEYHDMFDRDYWSKNMI